ARWLRYNARSNRKAAIPRKVLARVHPARDAPPHEGYPMRSRRTLQPSFSTSIPPSYVTPIAQPFQHDHLCAISLAVETCCSFLFGSRSGGFFLGPRGCF